MVECEIIRIYCGECRSQGLSSLLLRPLTALHMRYAGRSRIAMPRHKGLARDPAQRRDGVGRSEDERAGDDPVGAGLRDQRDGMPADTAVDENLHPSRAAYARNSADTLVDTGL